MKRNDNLFNYFKDLPKFKFKKIKMDDIENIEE